MYMMLEQEEDSHVSSRKTKEEKKKDEKKSKKTGGKSLHVTEVPVGAEVCKSCVVVWSELGACMCSCDTLHIRSLSME